MQKPILVIGATGYVGGRLVPLLLESGHKVRVLGRSEKKMSGRTWSKHPRLQIHAGNVLDSVSVENAMLGCRAAFYLVGDHNLPSDKNDAAIANVIHGSELADLVQLICLIPFSRISTFPFFLCDTGKISLTVFGSAMILGSGSVSQAILRSLSVGLIPGLAPSWMDWSIRPIAIGNVLEILCGSVENSVVMGKTVVLCGPETATFRKLLTIYSQTRGIKRRRFLSVRFMTAKTSSIWMRLSTPVPLSSLESWIANIDPNMNCDEDLIRLLAGARLLTCQEAISLALEQEYSGFLPSCYMDTGQIHAPAWTESTERDYSHSRVFELTYEIILEASIQNVWAAVARIGGESGWYFGNFLWRLRGWIDILVGGVDHRRGRRDVDRILCGDALDFWRVIAVQEEQRLVLYAEMKVPGEALLELTLTDMAEGHVKLRVCPRFLPNGILGKLYWWVMTPVHSILFRGFLRALAKESHSRIVSGPQKEKKNQV